MVGLRNALRGQVGGPERLRDDDVRVGQLFVEHGVRTFLVGGHFTSSRPGGNRHAAAPMWRLT
jgi:hypothetical protein